MKEKNPSKTKACIEKNEILLSAATSVQSLSRVRLSVTPCTAARQASLSITNSRRVLKLMSIESVMEITILSKVRQRQILYVITFTWNLKTNNIYFFFTTSSTSHAAWQLFMASYRMRDLEAAYRAIRCLVPCLRFSRSLTQSAF